ncbi:hypothetical protein [Thermobacillus xylanilyticus]|uniref:hypothetical protein n=1 Tax=Thermobacillus xylanilyticus TaxID=76633 RepID=UPI001BCC5350|nr:hypothetical protein [Thermobacillus xylanilyticus]
MASILISPLNLKLDKQNPRFVAIDDNTEPSIRKYMAMYEDVCQLAENINNSSGLLLGERIVVIKENEDYIVMEGNRRTVALQFLLDRNLIPDGFQHKIPIPSHETLANITTIEVDVASDRNYAIALMSKRHIQGVKNWKPLAKKQFFASMYSQGNSIEHLSERTGVRISSIRKDIRDYKFFLKAFKDYKERHPEFDKDIVNIKIDPFLRIFSANQLIGTVEHRPIDILKIRYDSRENTISDLPSLAFDRIVEAIFKATVVDRSVTTRNTLFDVPGVKDILDSLSLPEPNAPINGDVGLSSENTSRESVSNGNSTPAGPAPNGPAPSSPASNRPKLSGHADGTPSPGGPLPGGPAPGSFFENISWNKLSPNNNEHVGLITALNELHKMSISTVRNNGRIEKVYQVYSVAAGAVLRTAYEQSLKLQLKKTNLWQKFLAQNPNRIPMLRDIEKFVGSHIDIVLPKQEMRTAFYHVIGSKSRDFLNANIHNPELIRATSASLEGLANGGLRSLIQLIINDI